MRNNHDDRENAPIYAGLTGPEKERLLELYFQRKEAEQYLIDHNLSAVLKLGAALKARKAS